jgi:hypothetical protein
VREANGAWIGLEQLAQSDAGAVLQLSVCAECRARVPVPAVLRRNAGS